MPGIIKNGLILAVDGATGSKIAAGTVMGGKNGHEFPLTSSTTGTAGMHLKRIEREKSYRSLQKTP